MPEPLTIAIGLVALLLVLMVARVARVLRLRQAIDQTASAVATEQERLRRLMRDLRASGEPSAPAAHQGTDHRDGDPAGPKPSEHEPSQHEPSQHEPSQHEPSQHHGTHPEPTFPAAGLPEPTLPEATLREQVAEAEDRLDAVRRLHAAQVRAWNVFATALPWRLLGGMVPPGDPSERSSGRRRAFRQRETA